MANAPSCFVSVNEPINQPPGVRLPSIPQANDLQSALSAIGAMRELLNLLTGQTVQQRNQGQPGRAGQQGKAGKPGDPAKPNKNQDQQNKTGRWQEVPGSRVTQQVTMDSTDGSVTFTFNQINRVLLQDSVTGETWLWQR